MISGVAGQVLPAAIEKNGNQPSIYLWTLLGFTPFLALEQYLHWHHGKVDAEIVDIAKARCTVLMRLPVTVRAP
jgi:hypothetical protein